MTLFDREVSLEERGTETKRFNVLFGARLGVCLVPRCSLQKLQFAGRSKAQDHCLALEGSPRDRSHA